MTFSLHDVDVIITHETNGIYRLNINVNDLGMYIKGATMRHSVKNGDWWLQPPKHQIKNRIYKADIEFDTHTDLWKVMYEESINALKEWRRSENTAAL